MSRKPALAAAFAAGLLLAGGGAARADSGDPTVPAPTPTAKATQMQDGSQMGGSGMGHGSHEMQDGSEMQGSGMGHGSHQDGTTSTADRPRVITLGGFVLANVIVLAAAAVVRRRDRRRPARGSAAAGGAR